ncbi:MAG TPA: hypothetical protein VK421_02955 [Pyrinomonadaceae bacterium]|nr:hypothetical protein [Pyrinomonadaceae bacterium]
MEEKIILAVIGVVGGAFGSMFAPWANWGVEKRKQRLAYRRELVVKWREMLVSIKTELKEIYRKIGDVDYVDLDMHHLTLQAQLDKHPEYLSLKPYIAFDVVKKINRAGLDVWNSNVEAALYEIEFVIYKMEKKWKLV